MDHKKKHLTPDYAHCGLPLLKVVQNEIVNKSSHGVSRYIINVTLQEESL